MKESEHHGKICFLNMPARGHVNPTLAVVQELVRRGQEVSYYLTEEFRNVVQATGAVFQPYESKLKGMPTMPPSFSSVGGTPTGIVRPMFLLEDMRYVPPQVRDRIRADTSRWEASLPISPNFTSSVLPPLLTSPGRSFFR